MSWTLTRHVCRNCFGRIVRRPGGPGKPAQFMCADCRLFDTGAVESVCACGATLRTGASAGMLCTENSHHKVGESPELVALYSGKNEGIPVVAPTPAAWTRAKNTQQVEIVFPKKGAVKARAS